MIKFIIIIIKSINEEFKWVINFIIKKNQLLKI